MFFLFLRLYPPVELDGCVEATCVEATWLTRMVEFLIWRSTPSLRSLKWNRAPRNCFIRSYYIW